LATLVGINDYGRNLDIGDFCRHQLLWTEFRHRQLWPEAATMARIGSPISTKPFWALFLIFFFFNERIGWVIFVDRFYHGSVACHFGKERYSHGCGKRNSSTQYQRMWNNEKTQEKKMHTMNICGHFDFGYD
jgi:hypothetical protein